MLRSLYVTLDYRVTAADGDAGWVNVGWVRDFLFDDRMWTVHYLVCGIGSPTETSRVLILPFAAERPDWKREALPVSLTREQILKCPPAESDLPVSRQLETGLKHPGSHLRSMRELKGYRVYGKEGEIGSIEDFIIDDTLWDIHHVVLSLADSSRSVLVPPTCIRSLSWSGEAAWVNGSVAEFSEMPEFDPGIPVNLEQNRLFDYYGRPVSLPEKAAS